MGDQGNGMEKLIEELAGLKKYVLELEDKLKRLEEKGPGELRSREFPRIPLDARVSFIGEFDIVEALGLNLSAGGICIEMQDDMFYEMRFEDAGSEVTRRARLVWSRRLEQGGCRLGLEFVGDEIRPDF